MRSTAALLILALAGQCRPLDAGQRLVMSGDDIVEASEPDKPATLDSPATLDAAADGGGTPRTPQRLRKLTTSEVQSAHTERASQALAGDLAGGVPSEEEEAATRKAFEAERDALQGRLDESAAVIAKMDEHIDAALKKTKDTEAVLDPMVKEGMGDAVSEKHVELMQGLVSLGEEIKKVMQSRLQLKEQHFAMQKEMLALLQEESDRRKDALRLLEAAKKQRQAAPATEDGAASKSQQQPLVGNSRLRSTVQELDEGNGAEWDNEKQPTNKPRVSYKLIAPGTKEHEEASRGDYSNLRHEDFDISDRALAAVGRPRLGRKGGSFSSGAPKSLQVGPAFDEPASDGNKHKIMGIEGRPPSGATISLDVAPPLPVGVRPPPCDGVGQRPQPNGPSCTDGRLNPVLQRFGMFCENLPGEHAHTVACDHEAVELGECSQCTAAIGGFSIPEFLINTPDRLSPIFPDHGFIKLYEPFGGVDATLLRLREELLDNPRELGTLSEYCTALRAKGDTWRAVDCFEWSMALIRTQQFDMTSKRWEELQKETAHLHPSKQGTRSSSSLSGGKTAAWVHSIGSVTANLKINYGELFLRAGMTEEALVVLNSAVFDGNGGRPHKGVDELGKLALGHARDITATHTFWSARDYVALLEKSQPGPAWRVHHSPQWYITTPLLQALRWFLGGFSAVALCRSLGLRPWLQVPWFSAAPNFALCCEWGGALYALHFQEHVTHVDFETNRPANRGKARTANAAAAERLKAALSAARSKPRGRGASRSTKPILFDTEENATTFWKNGNDYQYRRPVELQVTLPSSLTKDGESIGHVELTRVLHFFDNVLDTLMAKLLGCLLICAPPVRQYFGYYYYDAYLMVLYGYGAFAVLSEVRVPDARRVLSYSVARTFDDLRIHNPQGAGNDKHGMTSEGSFQLSYSRQGWRRARPATTWLHASNAPTLCKLLQEVQDERQGADDGGTRLASSAVGKAAGKGGARRRK